MSIAAASAAVTATGGVNFCGIQHVVELGHHRVFLRTSLGRSEAKFLSFSEVHAGHPTGGQGAVCLYAAANEWLGAAPQVDGWKLPRRLDGSNSQRCPGCVAGATRDPETSLNAARDPDQKRLPGTART